MARNRAFQRRLRAFVFADIPTPLPIQNTFKEVLVMFSIHSRSAPFALDACANTSALVRQRFSTTSALALQRLALNRALPWRSA
jgi:hypothetical protein